jgi:xanthine dehydrogenase accessory factor
MEDIIEETSLLLARGERAALATLVWSSGSIPMSDRAKMLILVDGKLKGTIGGGCLEAEVLDMGRAVLASGESKLLRYTMTEKQAGESGLNCGGTVRIFISPVDPEGDGEVFARMVRERTARQGCTLVTPLWEKGGGRMLFCENGERLGGLGKEGVEGQVGKRVEELIGGERGSVVELDLEREEARNLGFDQVAELFVEPFPPPPVLYIFGGGHVGGQIASLAKNVGFRVVMIDDRPLFANPERHPDADEWVVGDMDTVFAELDIDDQSYIVAVTRGHQHDEKVVEKGIGTPARYIGMLGSERKKMVMWKRIAQRGGDRGGLDRVFAPIGFNIGADSPEEIAVSVVAELIEVRRGIRKVWKTKLAQEKA